MTVVGRVRRHRPPRCGTPSDDCRRPSSADEEGSAGTDHPGTTHPAPRSVALWRTAVECALYISASSSSSRVARSAGLIIISREITVSALREWAASLGGDSHGAVAVNWIGKWKTATQMASLTLLLLLRQETGESFSLLPCPASRLQFDGLAAPTP